MIPCRSFNLQRRPRRAGEEREWRCSEWILVRYAFAPAVWREAFRRMTALSDGQLRFVGLLAIATGIASLLFVVHA